MLAVADMDETIAFYQNVLGFTPTTKSLEYSIVERDGQTIHRATALPAFPRYERLALRAIGINEFVWLHDAPASPKSGLTSPLQ